MVYGARLVMGEIGAAVMGEEAVDLRFGLVLSTKGISINFDILSRLCTGIVIVSLVFMHF